MDIQATVARFAKRSLSLSLSRHLPPFDEILIRVKGEAELSILSLCRADAVSYVINILFCNFGTSWSKATISFYNFTIVFCNFQNIFSEYRR